MLEKALINKNTDRICCPYFSELVNNLGVPVPPRFSMSINMGVSSTSCSLSALGCYEPGTCSHQQLVKCRLEMHESSTVAL